MSYARSDAEQGYLMWIPWLGASLIARFMGPTWHPPGADRTQAGPMWASWKLLSGSSMRTGWNYEGQNTWGYKSYHPFQSVLNICVDVHSVADSLWIARLWSTHHNTHNQPNRTTWLDLVLSISRVDIIYWYFVYMYGIITHVQDCRLLKRNMLQFLNHFLGNKHNTVWYRDKWMVNACTRLSNSIVKLCKVSTRPQQINRSDVSFALFQCMNDKLIP